MANLDDLYGVDGRVAAFENHSCGLLVSLAGPGTGKTFALLRRINHLISTQQVAPQEICYLTFIKEISRAFLSDYQQEFGAPGKDSLTPKICTLHSLACRILRNLGFTIGLDGPLHFANIAKSDEFASRVFLNDLLPLVSQHYYPITRFDLNTLLEKVKKAWRTNSEPSLLPSPIPSILASALELARFYRLVDWDQAVPLAQKLYRDPANRQPWLTEIHHALIDEYQDFNQAEQAFIATLLTDVMSMVVVGDDNQSIFSSRGASPTGIADLFQSNNVDQVSLCCCRRSKKAILDASNNFLSFMRADARPLLPCSPGGEIYSYRFKSTKAELAFLSNFLSQAVSALPDNPRPRDGIVCLFPTNKALTFYYDNLKTSIPSTTRNPKAHQERVRLSRFMRLIANPNQRFEERLILEFFPSIKPRHKKVMVHRILQHDISPSQALADIVNSSQLTPSSARSAVIIFVQLCQDLSSQDPDRIAHALAQYLPVDSVLARERIMQFIENRLTADQDEAIDAICDELLPQYARPPEDPRAVLFLTMHSSKGLTKHTVIMPGLEDAWLPSQDANHDPEEEKRLFYVALTRATDCVLITFPRTRARGDPLNQDKPGRGIASRFVSMSQIRTSYHE